MKRITVILLLTITSLIISAQISTEIVWSELTKGKRAELTELSDGILEVQNFPYKAKFENKSNLPTKFSYEQDGREISFIPYGVKIRNKQNTFISAQKVLTRRVGNKEVSYDNILGSGISIINQVTNEGYKKIIKIENPLNFTSVLSKVDSIEIIFEIASLTFNQIEWNKRNIKYFTSKIHLDSLNQIESVKMWDADTIITTPSKLYVEDGKMYIAKIIPTSFILKSNRTVFTDVTITFGSEYDYYTSGTAGAVSIVALSETSALIAYNNEYNQLKLRVATISGTTISYGTDVTTYASYSLVKAKKISSTSALVVGYANGVGGKARVVTISGTTPVAHTMYQFSSNHLTDIDLSMFNSSTFIVIAQDNTDNNYLTASAGSISGNTISFGTNSTLVANHVSGINVVAYSSTEAMLFYYNSDDNYTYIRRVTYSGTTLTAVNNAVTLSPNYCIYGEMELVASGNPASFILSYSDQSLYVMRTIIVLASGTTVAPQAAYTVTGASGRITMQVMSPTEVVFFYSNGTDGTAKRITLNGALIYFDSDSYTFNSGSQFYVASDALNSTNFIVGYRDNSNSHYGTAKVGYIPSSGKKINGVTYIKWNNTAIKKWNNQ